MQAHVRKKTYVPPVVICQNPHSVFRPFSLHLRISPAYEIVVLLNAQISVEQLLLEKHRYLHSGSGRKKAVQSWFKIKNYLKDPTQLSAWREKQCSNLHERKGPSNNLILPPSVLVKEKKKTSSWISYGDEARRGLGWLPLLPLQISKAHIEERKGRQRALVPASAALSPSTLLRSKADGISCFPSTKERREMDHRN